jgi:hypothetical protein
MKNTLRTALVMVGASLIWTGCGDTSSTSGSAGNGGTSSATSEPMKAVEAAAKTAAETTKAASQEVARAVEAAKPQLEEAAKVVQAAVADASAAAQAKFAEAVAEVKKLIAEGKGSEAVQKMTSALAGLKLTPEQQKTLDELKAQAQAALSSKGIEDAKKAVGDLLKPKPQN